MDILEKEGLIIILFVLQTTVQILDQVVIPILRRKMKNYLLFQLKKNKEFRIPMITKVLNMIGENADLC